MAQPKLATLSCNTNKPGTWIMLQPAKGAHAQLFSPKEYDASCALLLPKQSHQCLLRPWMSGSQLRYHPCNVCTHTSLTVMPHSCAPVRFHAGLLCGVALKHRGPHLSRQLEQGRPVGAPRTI